MNLSRSFHLYRTTHYPCLPLPPAPVTHHAFLYCAPFLCHSFPRSDCAVRYRYHAYGHSHTYCRTAHCAPAFPPATGSLHPTPTCLAFPIAHTFSPAPISPPHPHPCLPVPPTMPPQILGDHYIVRRAHRLPAYHHTFTHCTCCHSLLRRSWHAVRLMNLVPAS